MAGATGSGLRDRFSCAGASKPDPVEATVPNKTAPPTPVLEANAEANAQANQPKAAPAPIVAPPPTPEEALRAWLGAHMPEGGRIVEGDGPIGLMHSAAEGDTFSKIAAHYVDLTTAYSEGELVSDLIRANPTVKGLGPIKAGVEVRVPKVVTAPLKSPAEARLGWPEDKALRAIYMNAEMMGGHWGGGFSENLDKMAARGINAVVVDAKDVTGWFTYPTKIPLALSINATKHSTIGSLARLVRVAHAKGIRVISRVSCFRDEHMGPVHGELAIKNKNGQPHVAPSKIVDWLDPTNDTVQQYLVDVVQESIDAGVDEIQLDYVRYPTEGIWDADFHLSEKNLTTADVITGFVHRVHETTKAAGVPLSLDVFGCVAWQYPKDMESTGQDLRRLGKEVEALSPMVYPSHFGVGFQGFEVPGDHPEIVAIGTKRAIDTLHEVGADNVVVRSWVQAFPWKSPHFGAPYIADQIKEAGKGGGIGWLAWNSGGEYGATYAAVPPLKKK